MNIENNKIIADFMGYKIESNEVYPLLYLIHADWFAVDELQFNHNWNWLMEVVEKIESLGYWTEICFSKLGTEKRKEQIIWCEITKENHTDLLQDDCFTNITRQEANTKIQAVYNACVEFIKWYNQNK